MAAAAAYQPELTARGYIFRIIQTPAGRASAISAAASFSPRSPILVVDQDASLSEGALAAFCAALRDNRGAHFFAFRLCFARSPSWLVRTFLNGWMRLPYIVQSPVVAGVYGISSEGRNRWQPAPAGIPDDKHARLTFGLHERVLLDAERYEVLPPHSYGELLATRIRYARSNRRVASYFRGHATEDAPRYKGVLQLVAHPVQFTVVAVTWLLAQLFTALDPWGPARNRR